MSNYEDRWDDPLPDKVEADLAYARVLEALTRWDDPLPAQVQADAPELEAGS